MLNYFLKIMTTEQEKEFGIARAEKLVESAIPRHTDDHWNFHLSDGQVFNVGKYKVNVVNGIEYPEGVNTEEEAIEIMQMNLLLPFLETEIDE